MGFQLHGAKFRFREEVLDWDMKNDHIEVETEERVFTCEKLLFTSGPSMTRMIPQLKVIVKSSFDPLSGLFQSVFSHRLWTEANLYELRTKFLEESLPPVPVMQLETEISKLRLYTTYGETRKTRSVLSERNVFRCLSRIRPLRFQGEKEKERSWNKVCIH